MFRESDFTFDDVAPLSWADAFPWLSGASGNDPEQWWNEPINSDDSETYEMRLGRIAELALSRLTHWTIGQIFPGLPSELDLRDIDFPNRVRNALSRAGYTNTDEISTLELGQILDWRSVGLHTVDRLLNGLAQVSTTLATPTVTNPDRTRVSDERPVPTQRPLSPTLTQTLADLRTIATWHVTIGTPDRRLLTDSYPQGDPPEIEAARRRIDGLSVSDLLSEEELRVDVARLFDDALGRLEPRAVEILANRLFADAPATLEELAAIHGVTRERIRQVEAKARGAMLTLVSEASTLSNLAAHARELIGILRPLNEILELIPALARHVERVAQPAWRVLDRLDDAYEIQDGWCAAPTINEAVSVTQTLLQEQVDEYGVTRVDEIDLVKSHVQARIPALTTEWLKRCEYVIYGDFVLTRTSSVGDYAAAILSIEGAPLRVNDIVSRFAVDRSERSVANAMGRDERFERVDRDRWALKEWGLEAYTGIRSIIRELVTRAGGRAPIDDVVEHITSRYNVSASSVLTYAGAPPFSTINGVVRLSGRRASRKPPERTRRLFRRPDSWVYRVRITSDHLRGSGSVAPMAIATILNLQPSETIHLDSALDPQPIAWTGPQPSFGSIRRFLLEFDVSNGTEVFLVLRDNRTFDLELMRELSGDPVWDALALIGSSPSHDPADARRKMATAACMPANSPFVSIIGAYRDRGDDDIADLLTMARQQFEVNEDSEHKPEATNVDEIMDLL